MYNDSLGHRQVVRPGQVNLMTAGRGISHSEESPSVRSAQLHGAQLWIALPENQRHCEPAFEHYPELPVVERDGFRITVLVGAADRAAAWAAVDAAARAGASLTTGAAALAGRSATLRA